ncbi:MAG: helix-turn-helix transcriptional regulator [Clostridia bacterium]|nr:helix-turn-helix transcriptional regulator [Clostridia bacterium]
MKLLLSENLKKLREEKGLTQSELADELSVTPQSVSRWEKGLAYPDIEKLPQLSKLFDVTIDELMGNVKSKLHTITQELAKVRNRLYEDPADSVRKEYFELLEESVNIGSNRFLCEYYNASRKMKKDKIVSDEKYDKVKETVTKKLIEMNPEERANALVVIVANEDEENFDYWEQFIGNDNNRACWNDILLLRSVIRKDEDKFSSYRGEVLFQDISKTLFLINQKSSPGFFISPESLENCLLAKELISKLSKRDDDIFIFNRITAETRLANTYLSLGDIESACMSFERIKELLPICKEMAGKTAKGSIDLFTDYEYVVEPYKYENLFFEIYIILGSEPFSSLKEKDKRLSDFEAFIAKLHGEIDAFCYLPTNERKIFEELYERAYSLAKSVKNPKPSYAFAIETAKGNIYECCICIDPYSDNEIDRFTELLKSKNDTKIKFLVGFIFDHSQQIYLEMPSHYVRTKLCDMNKQNLYTELLLQGFSSYIKKNIHATFSRFDQIKYE